MNKPPARPLFAGALLAAMLLALNVATVMRAMGPLHKPKAVLETDHRVYLEMTWDLPWRAEVEPPFCWRLVAPGLAHALVRSGLGIHAAWFLLTNLSLLGFLLAFHALLRRQGFGSGEAAAGLALVGLLPASVRWYEYQYWMTDPLALLLVTLGFLAIEARRDRWLPLLGSVGVATRETWLLVLPYYLLRRMREAAAAGRSGRRLMPTLAHALFLTLPVVAVLVGIRWLLPQPVEELWPTIRASLEFRWRHLFDNQLYFASLGSFGVLLPLALLHPERLPGGLRRRWDEASVVVVAYASLALGINTDRLLVYATPVLVPAALRGLRDACQATQWRWEGLAVASLVLQFLFWQQTPFHGVQGLSLYQPTHLGVAAALLGFWVVLRLAGRQRGPTSPRGD